jgi:hypothetical protein
MVWNWDEINGRFFCFSRYHDDGVPFEYNISPTWLFFKVTGTKELVPKTRFYFSLRRAIEWVKKQESEEAP